VAYGGGGRRHGAKLNESDNGNATGVAIGLHTSRGMAQVLATFTDVLTDDDGIGYRAQACGSEMPDGRWQGWVEFIPLDGSVPLRSGRETTQPNRADTVYWATGLTAVYLQGALQRALNPLVRPVGEPRVPAFGEPAPASHAATGAAVAHEAVLNPFAVYERGEAALRRQLAALSAWHLVNIVQAYRLSDVPATVLNHLPATDLIEIIVDAVTAGR
jgi:hypothetical protein